MDDLFSDENLNNANSSELDAELSHVSPNKPRMTTTIEKVLSPIESDANQSHIYDEMFDESHNDSNLRLNNRYKYSSAAKRSSRFSPVMGSTPKPRNKRRKRRSQHKNVWDKAIAENPELEKWIDSFNSDMKKVEQTELSITDK